MDLALAGKVAVVTGASKGIGLAATRALVDEGATVVAGARSVASLERIGGVTSVAVDLAAPDGPSQLDRACDRDPWPRRRARQQRRRRPDPDRAASSARATRSSPGR